MLIAVDARPLVEQRVGFGNMLYNTLSELLEADKENEYLLLSDREIFFPVEKYGNVSVKRYKDNLLFPKSFFYVFRLAAFLKRNGIKPDVFWGTEHLLPFGLPEETKKVLIVCDFTHIRFPGSTTKYNLLLLKLFFGPSIQKADAVACISQNTEKELEKFYPKQSRGKIIRTIYLGGEPACTEQTRAEENLSDKVKEIINERYILFVGTIEPRKNVSLLIKAAPRLRDKVHVVVCGKIGWEKESVVNRLRNTENLTYLNYVSADEKRALLKHCVCQVQPSLYEGFGLPVVESMQSGTVTLVADNSSLREIVEMEELRFRTEDADDFCNRLEHILNDSALYCRAKAYCDARGKQFDWGKTAREFLRLFTEIIP